MKKYTTRLLPGFNSAVQGEGFEITEQVEEKNPPLKQTIQHQKMNECKICHKTCNEYG